jgi:hypothetical protein
MSKKTIDTTSQMTGRMYSNRLSSATNSTCLGFSLLVYARQPLPTPEFPVRSSKKNRVCGFQYGKPHFA